MSTGRQRVNIGRHDDQEKQGDPKSDRPDRGLRLEVDELRDARDRAAERRCGRRPEDRSARQPRAVLSDPVHPGERPQPLPLGRRPLRAVVEALLPLTPVTEKAQPLELAAGRRGRGHDDRCRVGLDQRLRGVIAPDPRPVRSVLDVDRVVEEGGVRPSRRVDDRMGPVLLDLGVIPVGALSAGVLEQGDLGRPVRQGLRRAYRRRRRSACPPSRPRARR